MRQFRNRHEQIGDLIDSGSPSPSYQTFRLNIYKRHVLAQADEGLRQR